MTPNPSFARKMFMFRAGRHALCLFLLLLFTNEAGELDEMVLADACALSQHVATRVRYYQTFICIQLQSEDASMAFLT